MGDPKRGYQPTGELEPKEKEERVMELREYINAHSKQTLSPEDIETALEMFESRRDLKKDVYESGPRGESVKKEAIYSEIFKKLIEDFSKIEPLTGAVRRGYYHRIDDSSGRLGHVLAFDYKDERGGISSVDILTGDVKDFPYQVYTMNDEAGEFSEAAAMFLCDKLAKQGFKLVGNLREQGQGADSKAKEAILFRQLKYMSEYAVNLKIEQTATSPDISFPEDGKPRDPNDYTNDLPPAPPHVDASQDEVEAYMKLSTEWRKRQGIEDEK